MNTYLLIVIATGVTTAILGCTVYLRNPHSAMSRSFFLLCFSIIGWISAYYIIEHTASELTKLTAVHLAGLSAFNIVFWLFIFARKLKSGFDILHLPGPMLAMFWLAGSVLSASSAVMDISPHSSNLDAIKYGWAYTPFLITIVTLFVASIIQFLRYMRHSSPREKSQIRFILWGTFASVGFAIINDGVLPIIHPAWQASRITPIATLGLVATLSYAIIRHRLFDIRVVAARITTYVMIIAVLGLTYSFIVFGLVDHFIPHSETSTLQRTVYSIVAVFMAFTFQSVKRFFDRITDRIFFKDHYQTNDLLAKLSHIITSTIDLDRLTQEVLDQVAETMRVTRSAIYIANGDTFSKIAQRNMQESVEPEQALLGQIAGLKESVCVDHEETALTQAMSAANISLALPFTNNQSLKGVMILGEKRSGEIYTQDDKQVLQLIGPELAIAMENARSYKKVNQFNRTLQNEVTKATEQLQEANDQLTRKNRQLEQLDKLKDEFISITSHELRTPLTAIRGYLWMIINNRSKDQKVYLDRAYTSSERLITLVNDTLDISRIESGRVQLDPTPVKLSALAKQVVTELESRANQRRQTLTVRRGHHMPAAWCDADKIHQVLINLIGNALKFTPEGGNVTIHFDANGKQIITAISDTGPGITPENQKRLFQKFSRLDNSGDIPGSGLGLYLCQQIIQLSHGKIWLESEEGQGTTFFFSLPISTDEQIAASKTKQSTRTAIPAAA